MSKHKCIYCLEEKDRMKFNREHVVPRMMGTYQESLVLNDAQVCETCNSYFSRELENAISLDSYEAFLRMQHGSRAMSDGRKLNEGRISFWGNEGVFKGLKFSVVADSENEQKIHFDIDPRIGIRKDSDVNEYEYYTLEQVPDATNEIVSRLKSQKNAIVNIGLERETVESLLKVKGYISDSYTYSEESVSALHNKPDFDTAIKISIDSIIRRVCAKTVFNYLCFSNGKDYVLQPYFNEIRKYIRHGVWSDNLWFRYSKGPVSIVQMPNATVHSVGYMLFPEKGYWVLCGCLTWFGQLTYVFKLGITDIKVERVNSLPTSKMAYFNNEDHTISQEEGVFVYGGRKEDQYTVQALPPYPY